MFTKTDFQGYSVRFSPFEEGKIAVATAQNFGIIGNGKQMVYQYGPQGLVPLAGFDTRDGVYDCCWSEMNENILVSACGDGSVKVWDLMAPPHMNPIRSFHEHKHEVYGVHWNQVRRDLLLSASWDDTIRLWDLNHPGGSSVRVFPGHAYCVYSAVWSAQHAEVFLSASGDGTSKVWDLRQPGPSLSFIPHPQPVPGAPPFEVLTADWCKYNDCLIATGSVDKTIKIWDLR
jgi:peroxin-7